MKAGSPTYRELSARAHYSPTALSAAAGHAADVVLVVDQFEELFTLCGTERGSSTRW